MVADGHPLVVGQERVVGPHHPAHVGRVVDRRVEVGVVTGRDRHGHGDAAHRPQVPSYPVLQLLVTRRQQIEHLAAQRPPRVAIQRQQRIEPLRPAGLLQVGPLEADDLRLEAAAEIQHLVADRDPEPIVRHGLAVQREDTERQVLNREVGIDVLGRRHPAGGGRIVGRIEGRSHGRSIRKKSGESARPITLRARGRAVPPAVRRMSNCRTTGRRERDST